MTKPAQLEKEALRFPTIDPGVRIGHVHLKVADLQRALDFYCGVLGFTLTTSRPGAAFISAGGYHHHLGLNTWESLQPSQTVLLSQVHRFPWSCDAGNIENLP